MPAICLALLGHYLIGIPKAADGPLFSRAFFRRVGNVAGGLAYLLGILRWPYCILPYLGKLFWFVLLRRRLWNYWEADPVQGLRIVGDFLNLGLTTGAWALLLKPLGMAHWTRWLALPAGAEYLRLLTEKLPMLFSGLWQLLPHQSLAQFLLARRDSGWVGRWLEGYCAYYSLATEQRLHFLIQLLKTRAALNPTTALKLDYFQAFRVVPQTVSLRLGQVRDVARGEVFIHARWVNDPWLLIGQALRRSPWLFDPRYLRRPFYYRTEANRLATRFVLQHADYSFPYACYQFGHEIKVARYDLFYRLCRTIGWEIEEKVRADGTVTPEPLLRQLVQWLRPDDDQTETTLRALWSDDEVVEIILSDPVRAELPSASELASCYVYPLKYVEEVLRPRLQAVRQQASKDDLRQYKY